MELVREGEGRHWESGQGPILPSLVSLLRAGALPLERRAASEESAAVQQGDQFRITQNDLAGQCAGRV